MEGKHKFTEKFGGQGLGERGGQEGWEGKPVQAIYSR